MLAGSFKLSGHRLLHVKCRQCRWRTGDLHSLASISLPAKQLSTDPLAGGEHGIGLHSLFSTHLWKQKTSQHPGWFASAVMMSCAMGVRQTIQGSVNIRTIQANCWLAELRPCSCCYPWHLVVADCSHALSRAGSTKLICILLVGCESQRHDGKLGKPLSHLLDRRKWLLKHCKCLSIREWHTRQNSQLCMLVSSAGAANCFCCSDG